MVRRLAGLLVLTAFVAACGETITEPSADEGLLTTAMGPAGNGGNGNGATFTTSPYTGITHFDDDGDWCRVRNFDRFDDDDSDWVRTAKDGTRYAHLQDAVATMEIVMADGSVFTGEGRWSLNWHFASGKGANVSKAHGTVSDGVDTFKASCSFVRTKKGLNREVRVF